MRNIHRTSIYTATLLLRCHCNTYDGFLFLMVKNEGYLVNSKLCRVCQKVKFSKMEEVHTVIFKTSGPRAYFTLKSSTFLFSTENH